MGRINGWWQRAQATAPARTLRAYSAADGGERAGLLTYYGFVAVFPMLLAAVTVLGVVLRQYPDLQEQVLTSSLAEFPVLGTQLRANIHSLPGLWGLATGLTVGLLGARGFCQSLQRTVDVVWEVPSELRRSWLASQLRTLALVALIAVGAVGSAAVTAVATTSALRLVLLAIVVPGAIVLLTAVLRIMAPVSVSTRDLAVAGALAGIGLVVLQAVGSRVVVHLTSAREIYGAFATVLGLLAWLYLQSQVLVLSMVVARQRGLARLPRVPPGRPQFD